jgi:low temperature requirement protein LtrA
MTAASPHLRDHREEQRATTLELFFDLVFVFAITQISHFIIVHPTGEGFAKATFLLLVVWWAWTYTTWMTNWFDPGSKPVRLVLLVVAALGLLMAIALPEAFGNRALLFAGSYAALQVLRNCFTVWAVRDGSAHHRSFQRIAWWSIVTGAIWVAGALVGGDLLVPIWTVALVLDYAGPYARYWTPGLGASATSDWSIHPGHFAERFQLLVIIALGESIVVTGATAYDSALSTAAIASIVVAFATTAAMWWLYFNVIAERSTERLAASDDPGRLARDAYTYLHLPIVMGIILSAVGDELLIAHPDEPFEVPVLAIAGPVLYLLGHNLFRLSMARSISIHRLAGTFALVMLLPVAERVDAIVVAALALLVLIAIIVREEFIDVAPLERRGDAAAPSA